MASAASLKTFLAAYRIDYLIPMENPRLVKAEFHCHTCFSKDSLVTIEKLHATCLNKGIQRLVVTDHNSIEGALLAYQLDPDLFIVGEEVMTRQGELLGIFVKELVPAGLTADEVIERLAAQGAFIAVAHPFDTLRQGHWEMENLLPVLSRIDSIEVFNARCIDRQGNARAKEFARQHHLLAMVGSDSHTLPEVGKASLVLQEFSDAASLRIALRHADLHTRMSSPIVHFYSSYARWKKNWMHKQNSKRQ